MQVETGLPEDLVHGTGIVEQKLGLDAVDAGRVQQEFEQMAKKGVGDLERLLSIAGDRIGVAHDRLVALVDAEGEATDPATVERDEAGQDAGVEILQKQLDGTADSSSAGDAARHQPRTRAAASTGGRRTA